MILLTSRVSVEMVQKSAAIGAPLVVSVSAPTALAVRMADAAGITLAAIARADGFELFTHLQRIALGNVLPGDSAAHPAAYRSSARIRQRRSPTRARVDSGSAGSSITSRTI
jgi:FdhD protein